jgi:probable HAF family extracellular repeat protein
MPCRSPSLFRRWVGPVIAILALIGGTVRSDTYIEWKTRVFTEAEQADPAVSSETALSPAGDGIPNLLKYAFGIDPHLDGSLALPRIGSVEAIDPATGLPATYPTITYQVSSVNSPADLYFVPEISFDLQTWARGDLRFAAPTREDAVPPVEIDQATFRALSPLVFPICNGEELCPTFGVYLRLRVIEGESLPDEWQITNFGYTGINPTADADGDGKTNFDEFLHGTDPNDYYAGQTIRITVLSGDGQAGLAGRFLPAPFVLKIEDANGHALANAPVAFAVVSGGGGVAAGPGEVASQLFETRTDANGVAQASYLQSNGFGVASVISASAISRSTITQTTFECTTREGVVIEPQNIEIVVNAEQANTVRLTIANETPEAVSFAADVENGTIENLSYTDSDYPTGPQFIWTDISSTGTHLDNVSDADDDFEAFDISFAFPYFGNSYSTVYVSSNGFITFGEGSSQYHNEALPSTSMPANEIAACHTDLNLGDSGDVYYQEFEDRVVIQFTDAARYTGDGHESFQIVLQRDGAILFYYLDMNGAIDEATVGIQDATADEGLTIAYQTSYLRNNLAVRITSSTSWLSVSPANGVLSPGEIASLNVLLNQDGLTTGNLNGMIHVTVGNSVRPMNRKGAVATNSASETIDVPVTMNINEGPEIGLLEPAANTVYLLGERIRMKATAQDPDGVAVVEFYDGSNKIGESAEAPYSFDWNAPGGNHSIRARARDSLGAVGRSSAVSVRKDIDTDGDGLGDDWETYNFGDLGQDGYADWDGDGLSNIQEYLVRTSPVHRDSDNDGINDADEVNTHHTNPLSRDSDGDGMDDAWEVARSLNPLQNDSELDSDGDGLTNRDEFTAGSDPLNSDTDGDGVADGQDGWPADPDITLPRAAPYRYATITLGPFQPLALNNRGLVVGNGANEAGTAWCWDNGTLYLLGAADAVCFTGTYRYVIATGVNDDGIICGSTVYPIGLNISGDNSGGNLRFHACKWLPNQALPTDLGDLTTDDGVNQEAPVPGSAADEHGYATPNGTNLGLSAAYGMNGAGTVVGTSHTYIDVHKYAPWVMAVQGFDRHACSWGSEGKNDLGMLAAGGHIRSAPNGEWLESIAYAINDNGVVVGASHTDLIYENNAPVTHAFKRDNHGMVDLGTLGGTNSTARAISNAGQVVGYSDFGNPRKVGAFIASPGKQMKALTENASGVAYGVNTMGQVVGSAGTAVIWQNGNGVSLQSRTSTQGRLDLAAAIAENGSIACSGLSQGQDTGFLLVPVDLVVDANRDGVLKFADNFDDPDLVSNQIDETSEGAPYRFWLNDDQDAGPIPIEGDRVPVVTPDYSIKKIISKRNLEDFARLWIFIGGLQEGIASGKIHVGLRWKTVAPGTAPAINIYPSADEEGSDSYLKNETAAQAQISGAFNDAVGDINNVQTIGPGTLFIFKSDYWNGLSAENTTKAFLFEGVSEGKGELEIVFFDQAYNEIGNGGSIWLDLKNIKKMYQRASATPDPLTPLPYNSTSSSFDESAVNYTPDVSPRFEQPPDEAEQCLVFVHGWRMSYDDSINFSETMFKRLWWQGYKGRFAAFRWATQTSTTSYNTSEWLAWKYGKSLANYVENYIKRGVPNYTVSVAAHSMGNIVTGSALKRGMTLNTYMLMQAAVPSGCYNDSVNNYNKFLNAEATNPTPDSQAQKGYRLFLQSVVENVGKLVSFFNIDDYALATGTTPVLGWPYPTNWEKNEVDYKPNRFNEADSLSGDYIFSPSKPVGDQISLNWNRDLSGRYLLSRPVIDIQESMAFAARPRSKAAGAELHNATVFGSVLNLESSCNFGADFSDHGGQFMRPIQDLNSFYTRIAEELKQ